MPILPGPDLGAWCELLAVLGIGTSVAVALAAFISRRMHSAVWERAVWQACTLTLLALVALELTGLGTATVRLCVASWSANRSDREIAESAFTALSEDDDAIATHLQLRPANSALAAPANTWWPAIVWGIGSLGLLVRMAWGRALLAVFWWRCKPLCDVSIRNRVQSIANRLGLRRAIQTLTSNSLRSPAVFHWLFPVLALPSRFSDDYTRLTAGSRTRARARPPGPQGPGVAVSGDVGLCGLVVAAAFLVVEPPPARGERSRCR